MVSSGAFAPNSQAPRAPARSVLPFFGPALPPFGGNLAAKMPRLRFPAVAAQKRPLLYGGCDPGLRFYILRFYIMSVDAVTVRRIAHLARIAVTEAEVPHLQGELNAILAFVEQLSEVNVDGVEPMTSVTPMEMKKRPDVVNDGEITDDVVKNAPDTVNHFFLVPKVVE